MNHLDRYLPYADQPTEKPEAGQWRLIAPSGREFAAPSPILCVQLEQKTRVPAHVALGRIARMLNEPESDRPISAAQPASPARGLTAEESAEDLTYLKERVAYWDEHLTALLKEHGERVLLSWVVSMLANQDAADRALREQGR